MVRRENYYNTYNIILKINIVCMYVHFNTVFYNMCMCIIICVCALKIVFIQYIYVHGSMYYIMYIVFAYY